MRAEIVFKRLSSGDLISCVCWHEHYYLICETYEAEGKRSGNDIAELFICDMSV